MSARKVLTNHFLAVMLISKRSLLPPSTILRSVTIWDFVTRQPNLLSIYESFKIDIGNFHPHLLYSLFRATLFHFNSCDPTHHTDELLDEPLFALEEIRPALLSKLKVCPARHDCDEDCDSLCVIRFMRTVLDCDVNYPFGDLPPMNEDQINQGNAEAANLFHQISESGGDVDDACSVNPPMTQDQMEEVEFGMDVRLDTLSVSHSQFAKAGPIEVDSRRSTYGPPGADSSQPVSVCVEENADPENAARSTLPVSVCEADTSDGSFRSFNAVVSHAPPEDCLPDAGRCLTTGHPDSIASSVLALANPPALEGVEPRVLTERPSASPLISNAPRDEERESDYGGPWIPVPIDRRKRKKTVEIRRATRR